MKLFLRIFLISILSSLCSCTVGNVPIWGNSLEPTPSSYVHEVRFEGESLSLIALWYTGEMNNWQDIQRINPDLNARQIRIGEKIAIPRRLVVNHDALSGDFVRSHYARAKKRFAEAANVTFVNATSSPGFQRLSFRENGVSSSARIQSALDDSYRVKDIKGCEKFENNILGLELCANLIEKQIGYNNLRY